MTSRRSIVSFPKSSRDLDPIAHVREWWLESREIVAAFEHVSPPPSQRRRRHADSPRGSRWVRTSCVPIESVLSVGARLL
jgi:hypothetical protein